MRTAKRIRGLDAELDVLIGNVEGIVALLDRNKGRGGISQHDGDDGGAGVRERKHMNEDVQSSKAVSGVCREPKCRV